MAVAVGLKQDPARSGLYRFGPGSGLVEDPAGSGLYDSSLIESPPGSGLYPLAAVDDGSLMSDFAARVLAGLGPTFAKRAGDLLGPLVEGLTDPAAVVDDAVTDQGSGWPVLIDASTTTQPAWLAQLAGATVDPDASIDEQRAELTDRPNWKRGTPDALRTAIRPLLIGSQRVDITERDGSPWRTTITVYTQELAPGVALADIEAAAAAQKPVGIIFTCVVSTTATYNHFEVEHPATYAVQEASTSGVYSGTYADQEYHIPEGGTVP